MDILVKSRLEKMGDVKKYEVLRLTSNELVKCVNDAFYKLTGVQTRVSLAILPSQHIEAFISPEALMDSEVKKIENAGFRLGMRFANGKTQAKKILDYLLEPHNYFIEVVEDLETFGNDYIINIFIIGRNEQ
jgi:hypothetical protein